MKIDPSDKQQPIQSPSNGQATGRGKTENDFAKVLGDTVQQASDPKCQGSGMVRPSMPTSLVMPISKLAEGTDIKTAHGLLDALERYQQLLGDPKASLKMVAPAVDDLDALSKRAQPIVDNMSASHPLKTIVNETLLEMNKEIERFNVGHYVDE